MLSPDTSGANPPPASERRKAEGRFATHDGYIWPFTRHVMGTPECIIERMAEDLAALIREAGAFEAVCDDALVALGWAPVQVRQYGTQAARLLECERARDLADEAA